LPHDLYSSGGFLVGTKLNPVDNTKNIHPTPKKSAQTSLFKEQISTHLPTNVFISLKNMKEHFRLSSNFEETVDELGHRMEEILAQEKSLTTKNRRLEQLDELASSSKMREN